MDRHAEGKCAAAQGEHADVLCPEPIYAEVTYQSAVGEVKVYFCELHFHHFEPPVFKLCR